MNEHNAQNGAKKGTRTNRARPYVAMVSVLDLADGDKPELVERLAGLAGDDGHEHGGRLVGHVVQGDLAGGAGGRGRLHSGCSGGCGGRGSGLRGFFAVDDRAGDLRVVHQKDQAEKDDGHAEHDDQSGGTDGDLLHRGVYQKHVSSSSQSACALRFSGLLYRRRALIWC